MSVLYEIVIAVSPGPPVGLLFTGDSRSASSDPGSWERGLQASATLPAAGISKLPAKHQFFVTNECIAMRKVFENCSHLTYWHITI